MSVETDETPEIENETLELTEEVEQQAPEATEEETDDQGEEEELLVFGDEPEEIAETDNATIRHLRQKLRDAQKKLAETNRAPQQDEPIEVGEKPTLAACDYDEERYDTERDAWEERRTKAEAQKAKASKATDAEREAWEAELNSVNEEKAALNREDSEDAFATVREALTPAQQAIIVQTADKGNRAKLIYALAKNPAQLTELAGINIHDALSVAKFAKAVTQLEGKLKVVKRRSPPNPDTPSKGSAAVSGPPRDVEKRLAILRDKAQASGDYTEYLAAKRKLGR
jgi:hypothetical protein